jgi:hypothetical protein
VYRGTTPFSLAPIDGLAPALTPNDVTDMACSTVADPFLLRRDGVWYLFFEALNKTTGRGEIAYAISEDGLGWVYQGVVLKESFHLSYPHVFEVGGTVYMLPETRQANSIQLYAASSFPGTWVNIAVLKQGPYADASIFFHEGRWWIFVQRGLDEMQILTSKRLESGWTPHPMSPVWAGNRTYSRPGGRILRYGGELYRFAQDGVLNYGNNLRAMRITTLTDKEFAEEEIVQSPVLKASLKGWNAVGMHHLDAFPINENTWLGVVDGATIAP